MKNYFKVKHSNRCSQCMKSSATKTMAPWRFSGTVSFEQQEKETGNCISTASRTCCHGWFAYDQINYDRYLPVCVVAYAEEDTHPENRKYWSAVRRFSSFVTLDKAYCLKNSVAGCFVSHHSVIFRTLSSRNWSCSFFRAMQRVVGDWTLLQSNM